MKKIKVSIPENPEFSNLMRNKFKKTVPKNEYNVFGYCRYMERFAQWMYDIADFNQRWKIINEIMPDKKKPSEIDFVKDSDFEPHFNNQ